MHRVVWEQHFGPIPQGWHVHHRNGNKLDNQVQNLQCLPKAEHHKLHALGVE